MRQVPAGWISGSRAREKPTNSERILGANTVGVIAPRHLFSDSATRAQETAASLHLPAHALMERAGLAVAQLAMAVAPHARVIWIACGPGNNGGDGFEAARHLQLWGKIPVVTSLGDFEKLPADAATSRRNAVQAGVVFVDAVPDAYDLCIDALFGIGKLRPFDASCCDWIRRINSGIAPVIAVDVPSGLDAQTGAGHRPHVQATFTLSLLTLKPGLFTADGRQASGEIWFNSLDTAEPADPCAQLSGTPCYAVRAHNTHKGSFGDVCIVGGSPGMTGAAILAARAALHGGAGRVYVGLLDADAPRLDICQPELMFRNLCDLGFESMVVVAGCGGSDGMHALLPSILKRSAHLVLDADALNAIAKDTALQSQLASRSPQTTVLTPHPLEAARLMKQDSASVQSNRLGVAQTLADRFACTVVLKGSGTVIAAPGELPRINPSGNARLASAGTGDVLAGLIGARLAAGGKAFASACESVYRHGAVADAWRSSATMTARDLAQAL